MKDKELIEFWENAIAKGEEALPGGWVMYLTGSYAKATLDLLHRLKIQSNGYRNKAQTQKGELARLYKQVAEQKAEIERLQQLAEEQNAEITRLQEVENRLLYGLKKVCEEQDEDNIRAEAIKEYAWRFEKKIETSPYMSVALKYTMLKNAKQIKDNLLKEMVGE